MSRAWIPRAMRQAPPLDPSLPAPPMERGRALLINPFYAKDPHASFGKHVLTPTLALTSVAGATPAPWRVTYWDENLLAGRPPFDRCRRSSASPCTSPSRGGPTRWRPGTARAARA